MLIRLGAKSLFMTFHIVTRNISRQQYKHATICLQSHICLISVCIKKKIIIIIKKAAISALLKADWRSLDRRSEKVRPD